MFLEMKLSLFNYNYDVYTLFMVDSIIMWRSTLYSIICETSN